jgi:hypothetical protein
VRAFPNAKPEKISNRSSDENARDLAEVQLRLAQIFGQQIQRGLLPTGWRQRSWSDTFWKRGAPGP